jgi:hypothetical protein
MSRLLADIFGAITFNLGKNRKLMEQEANFAHLIDE